MANVGSRPQWRNLPSMIAAERRISQSGAPRVGKAFWNVADRTGAPLRNAAVYGRAMRIALLCTALACASTPGRAPVDREHPLVGRIWNGSAFLDEQALDAAVQSADFVLLGETHDNPDHHALQARLVRVAAQGRKPAIVFEMLDVGQQAAVDAAPRTSDAIAEAVDWSHSGW